MDRWILLYRPAGENEVPVVPSHPRIVLVFSSTITICSICHSHIDIGYGNSRSQRVAFLVVSFLANV